MMNINEIDFYQAVLDWFSIYGRKDLPWQKDPTPYSVWVSEVMLQQTQVNTVIPYYLKFMTMFPTLLSLAQASEDEVLSLWSGLGYYRRAQNLHKTAGILSATQLTKKYQQSFPETVSELQALPGIGRSTAGAIVALAMNKRATILDGNVKRVLTRCFAITGWPRKAEVNRNLWQLAEKLTPQLQVKDYTQAMMDLGATLCNRSKPDCNACPLAQLCIANKQGTQNEYPERKEKAALPAKHQYFYLLTDKDNRLLMEKRPPTGIWAGLWCPPAIDKHIDKPEYLLKTYGITTENETPLPTFKHTFSHFHLFLYPVQARIQDRTSTFVVRENNLRWDSIENWLNLGISAAVRKILLQMVSFNQN